MTAREKIPFALAAMATGIIAGALGCELVCAILFALHLFGDAMLVQGPIVGAVFGLIAGPIIAFQNVTVGKAMLWGGVIFGTLFAAFTVLLYVLGTMFRMSFFVNDVIFGCASGAASGALTAWLVRGAWPWLAGLSGPPPALPFTDETQESERFSV